MDCIDRILVLRRTSIYTPFLSYVISYNYPATCRPKGHDSKSAAAEAAAILFYIIFLLLQAGIFVIARLPDRLPPTPPKKQNKKQTNLAELQ